MSNRPIRQSSLQSLFLIKLLRLLFKLRWLNTTLKSTKVNSYMLLLRISQMGSSAAAKKQ